MFRSFPASATPPIEKAVLLLLVLFFLLRFESPQTQRLDPIATFSIIPSVARLLPSGGWGRNRSDDVSAEGSLALALSEWQRKHRVGDDNPMMAILDLVQIAVQHPAKGEGPPPIPPSFEEFRGTMELLDTRSNAFINQAADMIAELRRFGRNVRNLNDHQAGIVVLLTAASLHVGIGIGWGAKFPAAHNGNSKRTASTAGVFVRGRCGV